MRSSWRFLGGSGLLAAGLAVGGGVGCGASMRTVVESDMRFEHCYRIDDDAKSSPDAKRACWHDWVSHYTRGQDRNRVDYAKERLRVLSLVPGAPPPAVAGPVAGPAGPQPTSPYAPPPATTSTSAPPSSTAPSGWPPGASTAAVKP